MAAVREIEGLIDEREIGDDIADDDVLYSWPVLPRGIVWVTTADRTDRAGFKRDTYRSPPALDQARADRPIGGFVHVHAMGSFRQLTEDVLNQTTRFLQLVESNGHSRGHLALGANHLLNGTLRVR